MFCALSLFAALTGCSRVEPTPPRLPDQVLILVDTLRADALGYAGNPLPTSPNLDHFAASAAWFSRAYSPSTWTLPATASILTGRYPWAHRVVHDAADRDRFGRLDAQIPTIATALKAKGYRTAAFINNAFMAPEFGLNQGFDRYDFAGAELTDHRTAAETVALALEWLGSSDQPAFLLVHAMEPHADYQLLPPFQGRFTEGMPHTVSLPLGDNSIYEMITLKTIPEPEDQAYIHRAYQEEVLTTDAAIGALLEGLAARPGWDEAVVVFTSDHGEEFWEYGAYEHGHSCNSVVTRVPLIAKAPGVKPGRNDSVVSLVELFPLFVEGGGDALRLARSGAFEPSRVAISEDTLYTNQQLSAVTDDLRLTINLDRRSLWVLPLDDQGSEPLKPSLEPALQERGRALEQAVRRVRGGLEPTPALDSVAIPGVDTFEKLRQLGYIEE